MYRPVGSGGNPRLQHRMGNSALLTSKTIHRPLDEKSEGGGCENSGTNLVQMQKLGRDSEVDLRALLLPSRIDRQKASAPPSHIWRPCQLTQLACCSFPRYLVVFSLWRSVLRHPGEAECCLSCCHGMFDRQVTLLSVSLLGGLRRREVTQCRKRFVHLYSLLG